MAAWTLRRFSNPAILRQIRTDHLLKFLEPHQAFLAERGVTLPPTGSMIPLDYEALTRVFLSPDVRTPGDLIDALYFFDELATPEGMDALNREVERHSIPIDNSEDASPADLVVQIWLFDRTLLERKHVANYLEKIRSFEYYQTSGKPPEFLPPSEAQLTALTNELDDWFEERRRGRTSRVIVGEQEDGAWFLVRHGEPLKREESIQGTTPSSICFRPLKYDVLVYNPNIGELQINACSQAEKELFRTAFGKHLFGNEEIFPGADKYTLDPLRQDGAASLACEDIDGIDRITLREVQFYYGGTHWEVVSRKSDDYFALLESQSNTFPESGRLIRASFLVKFSESRRTRTVVIKPSNIAQFTRDDDSVRVERWLEARGFVCKNSCPKKMQARTGDDRGRKPGSVSQESSCTWPAMCSKP